MRNAINLLKYFAFYLLPLIFAIEFTAWVTTMPNLLDWLYQCPTGNIVCTTTLFCVVFVVAWIFFAFAVGIASELIKKWSTFKKFRERLNRWIKTPRIKHYFALPAHNDLRLYIKTPNRSKDVYVECWFKDYRDISGKKYLSEHHNELKLVENSYGVRCSSAIFRRYFSI